MISTLIQRQTDKQRDLRAHTDRKGKHTNISTRIHRNTNKQIQTQTFRQKYKHTETQILTDETNRETDAQTDRGKDAHTYGWTER